MTATVDPDTDSDTSPGPDPGEGWVAKSWGWIRGHKWPVTVVGAGLVVVGVVLAVVLASNARAARLDDARAEYTGLVQALQVDVADADAEATVAAEEARRAIGKLEGGMNNPLIVAVGNSARTASEAKLEVQPLSPTPLFTTLDDADVTLVVVRDIRTRVEQARGVLADDLAALRTAVDEYDLAFALQDRDTAMASTVEEITTAEAVLAGSEGKVEDNQVRADLRAALDAAIAVRDQEGVQTASTEALTAHAQGLKDTQAAVSSARNAVELAQGRWQSVQDEAARAAERERGSSGGSAGTSGASTNGSSGAGKAKGTGSPGSGSSSKGSGTGTSTPPKASTPTAPKPAKPGTGSSGGGSSSGGGGGTWIETETGFDTDLCGDTKGNTWEC